MLPRLATAPVSPCAITKRGNFQRFSECGKINMQGIAVSFYLHCTQDASLYNNMNKNRPVETFYNLEDKTDFMRFSTASRYSPVVT